MAHLATRKRAGRLGLRAITHGFFIIIRLVRTRNTHEEQRRRSTPAISRPSSAQAGQCADDVFQAEMKINGLTPRQLAVLMAVAENEGANQTRIVDRTGIDRATLAEIVRRLKRKGLLQRRRALLDQRAYAVKLTDEGRRVLRIAEPLAKKIDDSVLDALPAKRREQFVEVLQTIVTILQSTSQNGSPTVR
jgi:MarR family transcriptional regulator, temperature-dependent positive regulator of motility